jgi:hypothetical protein
LEANLNKILKVFRFAKLTLSVKSSQSISLSFSLGENYSEPTLAATQDSRAKPLCNDK